VIKVEELRNPQSCMSNALPHEMTFVLLSRDRVGALTVRLWCLLRVLFRKNRWRDDQIVEALACARHMAWQREPIRKILGKC
jgi:hypothetical protein